MAKKVRFEELIIGGLLKLGSLDQIDIRVLKEWLTQNYDIEIENGNFFFNSEYISYSPLIEGVDIWTTDQFFLNPNYNFDTDVSSIEGKEFPLRKKLEFAQGLIISECFENLDLNTFILRKLKILSPLTEEQSLLKNFSPIQIRLIENLQRNGYLDYAWNDDEKAPYDSFCQLRITKLGEARIFIYDNKPEVDRFCQQLGLYYTERNYNLLESFISKMDLNGFIVDILNINAFNNFCSMYDTYLECCDIKNNDNEVIETFSETNPVAYTELPRKLLSDKDGLLKKVFTINKGHILYVAHPNSLFNPKLILNGDELKTICWESIDAKSLIKYYEPKGYNAQNSQNAISCIANLIGSNAKDGKDKHCVILEQFSDNDKFLVRGIVKVSKGVCSIALNPEFEKLLISESLPRDNRGATPKVYQLSNTN